VAKSEKELKEIIHESLEKYSEIKNNSKLDDEEKELKMELCKQEFMDKFEENERLYQKKRKEEKARIFEALEKETERIFSNIKDSFDESCNELKEELSRITRGEDEITDKVNIYIEKEKNSWKNIKKIEKGYIKFLNFYVYCLCTPVLFFVVNEIFFKNKLMHSLINSYILPSFLWGLFCIPVIRMMELLHISKKTHTFAKNLALNNNLSLKPKSLISSYSHYEFINKESEDEDDIYLLSFNEEKEEYISFRKWYNFRD